MLGGGWAGTEQGGWRAYGIRAPGPWGSSAVEGAPVGASLPPPGAPSSTSTRVTSVPGSPLTALPEASREPGVASRARMGLAVCWARRRGWGSQVFKPQCPKRRGCLGSTQGPGPGVGWPPALAGPGTGWAALPRDPGSVSQSGCCPGSGASQQQGARGPSGPAPWAGRQGRSPAAEAQAGLQLQPGNRSRAEQHAAPGCSGHLKLPQPLARASRGCPRAPDPKEWLEGPSPQDPLITLRAAQLRLVARA